MGSAPGKALEGGSHSGRLSTVRGRKAVAAESSDRREWQRGPAAVGGRGDGEGLARR
jgi:hypothetical protein